jgi:hypothetical protein
MLADYFCRVTRLSYAIYIIISKLNFTHTDVGITLKMLQFTILPYIKCSLFSRINLLSNLINAAKAFTTLCNNLMPPTPFTVEAAITNPEDFAFDYDSTKRNVSEIVNMTIVLQHV